MIGIIIVPQPAQTRVVEKKCVYIESVRYCEDRYISPEQARLNGGIMAAFVLWLLIGLGLLFHSVSGDHPWLEKLGIAILLVPVVAVCVILIAGAFL